MRHGRRSLAVAIVAAGLLVLCAPGAWASGGGGCGRPVTDASGTTIAIRSYCFTPTILRIGVGGTVTWVNRDPVPHTVLGANGVWGGYETLKRGADATYRFDRPGVYPYVCTYHPGMVGVVVVGSATGRGAAGSTTTSEGPVEQVLGLSTPAPTRAVASVVRPTTREGSSWRTVTIAAVAVLAALGVGLATSRRRRDVTAP